MSNDQWQNQARFSAYGEERIAYVATILIYLLLAVLFALQRSEVELALAGTCALFSSAVLMQKDFVAALSLTILVTHIGPILKVMLPVLGMVNIGDLYLAMIVVVSLYRHLCRPVYLGPFRGATALLPVCLVISVPFLPDVAAAVPGYISLVQLAALYLVVMNEIRTDRQVDRMFDGIGWAVLVSALLQLAFYTQGVSLGLAQEADEYQSSVLRGEAQNYFVKTTFFYVSFYGSCTAAMVIAVCRILWRKPGSGFFEIGFWFVVFMLATTTSLVAGSRTALLSAAMTIVVVLMVFAIRLGNPLKVAAALVFTVGGITLLIGLAIVAVPMIISESQFALYAETMTGDLSLTMSVGERLIMWSEVPEKVQENPMAFLFGVGPDVPQRAPELPAIQKLMQIQGMEGFQPPSFHNFYVDLLAHLGLGAFVLLLFVIAKTLLRLRQSRAARQDLTYCCLFALLAWLLLWTTHATGWSKPVLIMSELFALSHLLISGRIYVLTVNKTDIHGAY